MTEDPCSKNECVYATSDEFSFNETSGDWVMGSKTSGTVSAVSGGRGSCLAAVFDTYPGESGDSGPIQGYSPNSDTSSSSGSFNYSFSDFGFSIGGTESRTASVYGPYSPNTNSSGAYNYALPAFGSEWDGIDHGGCTGSQEGLGSADAIKLGSGQNPNDTLGVGIY